MILEPILLSAVQHYSYCPRQCALIHMEQVFEENVHTFQGGKAHAQVDKVSTTISHGVHRETSLPLWSDRLGLVGKADLVEFIDKVPYPVEFKHGPKRSNMHDDLQLCAQALCLEEMLDLEVPKGAVYHFSSRRRREVVFDHQLRTQTLKTIEQVRKLLDGSAIPVPLNDARCRNCSLAQACVPELKNRESVSMLLDELYESEEGED